MMSIKKIVQAVAIVFFIHNAYGQQNNKVAFITGITGQDGSYLAEFLLSKDYIVHGTTRRSSTPNTSNVDHLINDSTLKGKFFVHYADLTDFSSLQFLIQKIRPDEVYNIAAQSDVRISFDVPMSTADITGLGVLRVLEAVRQSGVNAKVYQASTSELFGSALPPQSEMTPFQPQSPYAVAKLYGYWITANYRDAYKMFACNGLLFNHESPRRGENFITRKITRALAAILAKKQDVLELGNIDAKRDWGFAPEYVECMWKILQYDIPGDYVMGTGNQYSVREFVERAFGYAGITIAWQGAGINEIGYAASVNDRWKDVVNVGQTLIKINPYFFRPTEVVSLCADARKTQDLLGWKPLVDLEKLVKIMVDADLDRSHLAPVGNGIKILREEFPYIRAY